MPIELRYIGRLSAPIFYFMLVEGYHKTSNKKKYLARLSFFAVIFGSGNVLLKYYFRKFFEINIRIRGFTSPNIMLAMAFGFILMILVDKLSEEHNVIDKITISMLIIINIIISNKLDYSIFSTFMILTFHTFYNRKKIRNIVYVLGSIILCTLKHNSIQLFMILSIIPISLYNGEKGRYIKIISSKYFFYIFYVMHIWVFNILSAYIYISKIWTR